MGIDLLIDRGFYIFPLNKKGKAPAIHNWPGLATNNKEEFIKGFSTESPDGRKYFVKPNPIRHMIAVVTKPPLIVVDIDNHNDENIEDTLEKFYKKTKAPKTFTVRTKSGGLHLYYNVPRIELCKELTINALKYIEKNIDFKCNRSYVVAPDDDLYKITDDREINDFPVLELFNIILKKQNTDNNTHEPQEYEEEFEYVYEAYVKAVLQNCIRRIHLSQYGEVNTMLYTQTANISAYSHYNFFTLNEIGDLMLETISIKARNERWDDWKQYKRNAVATIRSGIKMGKENPKYIIINKVPRERFIEKDDELLNSSEVAFF